jgi:elongation factor Ts
MADIPATLVKQLRDMTGAGMMDAKRALQEVGGDVEQAITYLRQKGMASAAKRADRATTEGEVLATVSGSVGAIAAIGCETEPVSKNEEFLGFAERVLETVEAGGSPDSLEQQRTELVGKIGENVAVVGTARMEAQEGELLAEYVHPPANKIGVLVKVRGTDAAAARRLAMHISFSAPLYATRDQVPGGDVERERSILEQQEDVASKPEQVRGKIVQGRLEKWFGESVLVDQPWIHESSLTVGKALGQAGLVVVEFQRFALG